MFFTQSGILEDESMQILKRRLASGEISKEEFEDLKSTLE